MATHYSDVAVRCPFYHRNSGPSGTAKICCEGITDDSIIQMVWRTTEGRRFHYREYCCKRYICCEIYRMLMDCKYDEET